MQRLMKSGKALEKLKELVRAQGGDDREVDEPDRLPQAPLKIDVRADQDGVVDSVDAEQIGMAAMSLGAGRETKGDVIDLAVGIVLHKKIGDAVHKGEPVATIHANDASKAKRAVDMVSKAVQLTDPSQQVTIPSLIYGVVD